MGEFFNMMLRAELLTVRFDRALPLEVRALNRLIVPYILPEVNRGARRRNRTFAP